METTLQKLEVLADAAKYDVSCASSGEGRNGKKGMLGNCKAAGICHSFTSDGRCVSLLKVLMTNACAYDCKYCLNRRTSDVPRATFEPRELAELTYQFYRRNYIEGLFLSSGVLRDADYTSERMITVLELLRNEYRFNGYIHVKAIPGASGALIARLGQLADRMSVNIELPSEQSLVKLAPEKGREAVLRPMKMIQSGIQESTSAITRYRAAPRFVPAGQSTQMIIGATPDTDYQILRLTQSLYRKYTLKRVYFSAYIPVREDSLLPSLDTKPPLLREHRLYQADWLLRFYGFDAEEILDEQHQEFNPLLDPKCNWAINHMEQFPVEVNAAPYEMLLRVPGIGVTSARRIIQARRYSRLDFDGLKKIGVVLKRARYFLLCGGKTMMNVRFDPQYALQSLITPQGQEILALPQGAPEQLSLFSRAPSREEVFQCVSGQI